MTPQLVADREETGLVEHMAEQRVDRSRKRGKKRLPQGNCVLPRTAEQLIRGIVKATADGSRTWAEANNEVARSLHVDRSTVVRMVRRLCEVGILTPVETRGGRGRVSMYAVDRSLAEEALRSRRWPVDAPNQRTEEAQEEGQKAGQWEEPAQRMPPFREGGLPTQTPPCGARQNASPNSDAALGGKPLLGDLDPSVLAALSGRFGIPAAPLPRGIHDWWEVQPETARRAIGATAVGAALVAGAGLLGGWRAAGVAALVAAPAIAVYALSSESDKVAEPSARPEEAAPADEAMDAARLDPLFQALAGSASRSSR